MKHSTHVSRVMAIPRYRRGGGPALLSAGFRPFFLFGALWAALAIPIWLTVFAGESELPSRLAPLVWHGHEMIFGYGAAVVAGFLLTAIPNWTGRMPLQDGPLAVLLGLWATGRFAVLLSAKLGPQTVAALDLAFPAVFAAVVAREIVTGRNWRNLPMLGALALLFSGNLLVHLDALGVAATAEVGNRIGVATLLMLISFVGGRIVPSFTRNWLTKERPEISAPTTFSTIDRAALAAVALALVAWAYDPDLAIAPWLELLAGAAVGLRLTRWRGQATVREPLLTILHIGYGWLALGFVLLAASALVQMLPPTTALHALTTGAIGTMTLAVMTRASLGHTGRPLVAGRGTITIYLLVTVAAVLRLIAPIDAAHYIPLLAIAGAAWSGAFGLFVLLYGRALAQPRIRDGSGQPI
jgi:uncharacterized protein involved in response to NO